MALPGVETLAGARARRRPRWTDRLARILAAFGRGRVFIDVQRHRRREQEAANQALLDLADALGLAAVATNGVRHARSKGRALLDVLTCIREKRTLATAGRLLAENAERHLKAPGGDGGALRRPARPPAQRRGAGRAARRSPSRTSATASPTTRCRRGRRSSRSSASVTEAGARERYRPYHEKARRQIERELALIGKLELAGYFLIVWDLVNFCRREGILVQGRGSAANSAVCYSLGITAVDPVGMELLFERFLSEERGEWPDIDLDLPERRPPRAGHPARLRALRGGGGGHDRERHHLPRPQRLARDRQGARASRRTRSTASRSTCAASSTWTRTTRSRAASSAPGSTREDRRIRPLRPALRGDPGPAAAPRPALGRDGDRPGPARRGGAPRARDACRAAWSSSGTRRTAPTSGSSRWTSSASA